LERGVPERWRSATFAAALGVGFVMTGVIYLHALSPVIAIRKDPSEQMRGWPALADAIDRKRRETGAGWVATSSYATTAQLAMALKGRSEVAQLDQRIRYIFLPPLPAALVKQPALYVEIERRVEPSLLSAKFRKITPVGTLKRDNGSKEGAMYKLFLLDDAPQPPL
jgi:hypothetical protein